MISNIACFVLFCYNSFQLITPFINSNKATGQLLLYTMFGMRDPGSPNVTFFTELNLYRRCKCYMVIAVAQDALSSVRVSANSIAVITEPVQAYQ